MLLTQSSQAEEKISHPHTIKKKNNINIATSLPQCAVWEFLFVFNTVACVFVVLITKYVTISYASAFAASTSHDQFCLSYYYDSPNMFDEKIQDDCDRHLHL
ncbi:hypothetical protein ACKWTF_002073 [Chironomus riparius]